MFTQEFIEKNQLNENQVKAVTSQIEELKQKTWNDEWSGKANELAEGIINGAGKKIVDLTGIQREQGEKWADYLKRSNELYFEGTKNSLETKKAELEEKLKNVKGDESLKTELAETKELIKTLKQKEAQFDEWSKEDYKGKYESTLEKLNVTERKVAFNSVVPAKPDDVNQYEWKAKLSEWQKEITEKNNIVLDDDGEPWAVDKENEFKKTKLKDLFEQDKDLQELVKGRQVKGLGEKKKIDVNIEGVPFKVPESATAKERQQTIKDYLTTVLKLQPFDERYSKLYAEYNTKILQKTA